MSVLAVAIKHLAKAGFSNDDIVYVVELMEEEDTGEGRLRVFIEILRACDIPSEIAGLALLEVAQAAVAWPGSPKRAAALRDAFTGTRDSNRARRGMSDSDWRRLRQEIFERDGHKCQYCFSTTADLTCDHIEPLVRGGTNDPDNLTTACRSCNSSKGDKLIAEWSPM